MRRRLWRVVRPQLAWIVFATLPELLGWLLFATYFLADGEPELFMFVTAIILITAPLPWLLVRLFLGRLWRDIRRFPLTMAIGAVLWIFGGLIGAIAFDLSDVEIAVAIVALCLMAAPLVWLAVRVISLRLHRRRIVRELREILGDDVPLGPDTLAVTPFVIAGPRIYCMVDKALEHQDIAGLVWAYGEVFSGWFRCQLVILNRDARAVVLPLWKIDLPAALDRLRAAAPWIAAGFNRALVDSWNFDHRELLETIDRHREAGTAFAAPWAQGAGPVAVAPRVRTDDRVDAGTSKANEDREIAKALARWSGEAAAPPASPTAA